MPLFNISYDLKGKRNYDELHLAVRSESNEQAFHCLGSTWVIISNSDSKSILSRLINHIDSDDCLLVSEITVGQSSWAGFGEECAAWLASNS